MNRLLRYCATLLLFAAVMLPPGANAAGQADVGRAVMGGEAGPRDLRRLFGFNLVWNGFQKGYIRNGRVDPELEAFLAPFEGAVYRFPGGSISKTYEWQKAVGPLRNRSAISDQFQRQWVPEFGPQEFVDFLADVNGVGILVGRLNGRGDGSTAATASYAQSNAELWSFVQQRVVQSCPRRQRCSVPYFEVGNEMDWGRDGVTADQYVSRARPSAASVDAQALEQRPVFLVHSATAPWGSPVRAQIFDKTVKAGTGNFANAFAMHLYYDGLTIPAIEKTIDQFVALPGAARPIAVTEHGRWPDSVKGRPLPHSEQQLSTMESALSVADFQLMVLAKPQVVLAAAHMLGDDGPWRMIHRDPNDTLVGTTPYWALRLLREGLGVRLLWSKTLGEGAGYPGGYAARAILMKKEDGRLVLLAVNRSRTTQRVRVPVPANWTENVFINKLEAQAMTLGRDGITGAPSSFQFDHSGRYEVLAGSGQIEFLVEPASVMSFEY